MRKRKDFFERLFYFGLCVGVAYALVYLTPGVPDEFVLLGVGLYEMLSK